MKDFVISVNSTVDLPKEWLDQNNVNVMPIKYTIDDVTYEDYDGKLSSKAFFDKLRAGSTSVTSQVNPEDAKASLEPLVKAGKDVLHLSFSSSLSGTYNSIRMAIEELKEEYPDAKIQVIDTLCACMGEGLLLHKVIGLKNEGKTFEEIAQWVEDNKLNVCHFFTVDDLNHLHRGGRVSKASAVIGTLVQIKPILHMDNEGALKPIGKERGRKKALGHLVDMAVEHSKGWDNDVVMIAQGDALEDAQYVEKLVKEKMGVENVLINEIGSVIGSHTGPGIIALFCMGEKR
jgi:DegV family protein with EDD domain